MSQSNHVELFDREFDPSSKGLPVDIATLAQLRARVGDALMERPGRVYFDVAIICTTGEGLHEVDFMPVTLKPGRVVHVRPGQVHRWRFARDYEATILFFQSDQEARGWSIGPQWRDLTDVEQERSLHLIDLTVDEYDINRPTPSLHRALRGAIQLITVNLGLDRTNEGGVGGLPKPYVALMAQLETDRGWSRSVKDRAERLGYSARTLSRACQSATGKTAKEVVDDRVLLEARRLLIHSDNSVESVGRELSFTEASNFAKFFHRMAGENPEAWRKRHVAD